MTSDKTSQSNRLPEVVTPSEMAEMLKVSEKTVARLLRAGEIKGFKIGGQWRISQEECNRILAGAQVPA